ncbi:hypothetical protein [Burkholderia aenigmatica]|uniref:hypothetical protein n=1 Tax=Burkholderia aenigmatica TaxID=2015348 RepID=UPI001177E173|nr:hypothetical protein [Burkholderia aenigmatica]
MKDSTRARVAAVVGAAALDKKVSSVYDYGSGKFRTVSVHKRDDGGVSGYDFETSTHFSGGSADSLNFYDYQNARHVNLKLDGGKFSGYDYDSGFHFSGTVKSQSISIYDYETGRFHNYRV